MGKYTAIIAKYNSLGVSDSNIDFAISSVKDGIKREHILENLLADYRGMNEQQATALLEELFAANGGEFKKENQGGYLYGSLFLLMGLACVFYIYYANKNNQRLIKPILIWIIAIAGTGGGLLYFIAAMRGKFREDDAPFKE